MPAPWELKEARLVQLRSIVSAANALSIGFSTTLVPAGKVWCVIGVAYYPSVAETKIVSFEKVTSVGNGMVLLNPISIALNPAAATPIEQGMEIFLLPGEYLLVRRDSATAGSTMSLFMQFVEIDLPLYTYDEPQVVRRQVRALSTLRSRLGGGLAGAGSVTRPPADRGGGGGGRGLQK